MGGCLNPQVEDICGDESEVAFGGPPSKTFLSLGAHSSKLQLKNLYSAKASEFAERQLVTSAHKEILMKCRGLLDKLDQCETRSTHWNNWIFEIINLLVSVKLKNKAQEVTIRARQTMSSLLNYGSEEDKAIGNYFLKLTDNYWGTTPNFFTSRAHSVLRSQPRLLPSKRLVSEFSISEATPAHSMKLETMNTYDSQIWGRSPSRFKFLQSPGSLLSPRATLFPGLKNLLKWNFDPFAFSNETNRRPLSTMFLYWCSKMQADRTIEGINAAKLSNYIIEVESQYGNNPYHNFIHAADVLHSCINLMETEYLQEGLNHIHRFALAFAAAVHDFRHPGVGNDFLVKTNDKIATTYNDTSVLENWHTSQAFLLLKKPEFNFLRKVEATIRALIRQRVIYAILMTDMKRHGEHVEELQDFLENRETASEIIDPGLLISHCLHVSDISHPTKKFSLHQKWSSRITKEFLQQGDREVEHGMEPGALYDRRKANFEKSQIGFIDFVVLPLWVNWTTLIGAKEELIDRIHSNKDEWLRLLSLKEQEEQSVSFYSVTAKDKEQEENAQSPVTNGDQSQGKREDKHNDSKRMPIPHADVVSMTSSRNTTEQNTTPNVDEKQHVSLLLQKPRCRASYPELNHSRLNNQILVPPQELITEERVSVVSNSNSPAFAYLDPQHKAHVNRLILPKARDSLSSGGDLSIIKMSSQEDESKKSTAMNSPEIFQLQQIMTDSLSNISMTNKLALGKVASSLGTE